jgi:hypothetical protein
MRYFIKSASQVIPTAIRHSMMSRIPTTTNANTQKRPFSAAVIAGTNPGSFDFSNFSQKQQPMIDLENMSKRDGRGDGDESEGKGNGVKSDLPGKFEMSLLIPSSNTNTMSKLAIKTLIAAFLIILIGNSVGDGVKKIKNDTVKLTNEITETVYNFMITTASERLQEGDTTIIASIYVKIGRHVSTEKRKELLENLVINGVSYGWLAEYDGIIEQWLNKIIEIKGGELPSDKYIIKIVNIIQNKVIPVTNGLWYFKRAVKLRTGLGVTAADAAPDSYWYTSEGQTETAKGARETLADDTTIAKVIVGLLSAIEMVDNTNTMIESLFGDINNMLRKIIDSFKLDLANAKIEKSGKLDLILEENPVTTLMGSPHDAVIKMQIRELNKIIKKCENYLDHTKSNSSNIFRSPTSLMRKSKTTHAARVNVPNSNDSMDQLRKEFSLFNPAIGGGREARAARRDTKICSRRHSRSRSRSRSHKLMRRYRRRTRKR